MNGDITVSSATDPTSWLTDLLNTGTAVAVANNLTAQPAVIAANNAPAIASASNASKQSLAIIAAVALIGVVMVFHKG
jgi:hypothetical protein